MSTTPRKAPAPDVAREPRPANEQSGRTPFVRRLGSRRGLIALAALAAGLVLLLVIAYLAVSLAIYTRLSAISPGEGRHAGNTPESFRVRHAGWEDFDASPYFMPGFEEVRFPSREAGIELSGWFVEGDEGDEGDEGAPAVVLVHGIGECKASDKVLIPAGMLRRNGFATLLVDVREHGMSDVEDGRTALGGDEYLDVLGAWDWLVRERAVPPARIGLFGVSLGGATVLVAAGEGPRVAAVFADSSFADVRTIIDEELTRNGYPTFLSRGGILMARLVSGDDLLALSPESAVRKLAAASKLGDPPPWGDRPLFVTHGLADGRVGVHHGRRLADIARAEGLDLTTWFVPDADHADAMLRHPDEYEKRLVAFFRKALGPPTERTTETTEHTEKATGIREPP